MSLNLLSIMDGTKTLTEGFSTDQLTLVVILGVGIVFLGLICIVLLCSIMSKVMKLLEEPKTETPEVATPVATAEPIANKQELIAVIASVIAEDMGADVEAIRIKSIKRI